MGGPRRGATCAICGRSLLVGERALRFSPDGREYVDVCPLCKEDALARGWVSEGGPSLSLRGGEPSRRGVLSRLFNRAEPVDTVAEPILRQLSGSERAMVEAANLFNLSAHRRTVEGLTRSLGWPAVSIVPLSGKNPEVVITVCWEISWYQFRIVLGSASVRLAQRGQDADELHDSFKTWNAEFSDAGLVVPRLSEEDRRSD